MDRATNYEQQVIDTLRVRWQSRLNRKSVYSLSDFIGGFCFGVNSVCLDLDHTELIPRFYRWLRAEIGGKGEEWTDALLRLHGGDHESAFDAFFEYWDRFRQSGHGD